MRKPTDDEVRAAHGGWCPFCGSGELKQGPRGGLCVNVICPGCGARLNFLVAHGMRRLVDVLGEPTRPHRAVAPGLLGRVSAAVRRLPALFGGRGA